ncbi:Lrp/AsnC family transcriptional regulator [bacterium]|nr:Lrp/AsnC family transcriptional regulator [bacterium]
MAKIDSTDLQLLHALDRNARLPFSKLGDEARISQEAARYRVQRLFEEQVIHSTITVVDSAKLGFAYYKIFLKLHSVNEQHIEQIIDHLNTNPDVAWVVRIEGNFDIGFALKVSGTKDLLTLNSLVEDLTLGYHGYVSRRVFCINIAGEYLSRDYLVGRKRKDLKPGFYSVFSDPVEVDHNDQQIIRKLTTNARLSAVDLAAGLDISSDAVLLRLKKLEQKKVITRYTLVLHHSQIGHLHYKVFLYLNRSNPEKHQKLLALCKTKPHVIFIVKTFGEWDYELELEVESVSQMRQVMMEITSDYADVIHNYDALLISRIHKYNLFP